MMPEGLRVFQLHLLEKLKVGTKCQVVCLSLYTVQKKEVEKSAFFVVQKQGELFSIPRYSCC